MTRRRAQRQLLASAVECRAGAAAGHSAAGGPSVPAWLDPKRGGAERVRSRPDGRGPGAYRRWRGSWSASRGWSPDRAWRSASPGQLDSIAYPAHLVATDPEPPSAVALLDGPIGRR